jgi:hypothetical protein
MEVMKRGVPRARILQPIPAGDKILQYAPPRRDESATW